LLTRLSVAIAIAASLATAGAVGCRTRPDAADGGSAASRERQLPTGVQLDPIGRTSTLGSMPLAIALPRNRGHAAVLLGGWREQGVQIVETTTGRVVQTLVQPAAFVGLAFSSDDHSLFVSGGAGDVVYRYAWSGNDARIRDTMFLGRANFKQAGDRYAAGLALSPDDRTLYVAENLDDSLAVIDVATRRVIQRLATDRYPYGVAAESNGMVYVSAWGANVVTAFTARSDGTLSLAGRFEIARHPSTLLLNASGSRLFVASGSTDRVVVFDTKSNRVIRELSDTPPGGPGEGSTPDALALSRDGRTLYVAEADNNAVAMFALGAETAGIGGSGEPAVDHADSLVGRVPTGWYPTGVAVDGGQLLVVSGKGLGTGPNLDGPTPARARYPGMRSYTLGQTTGTLSRVPLAEFGALRLPANSARVAALDHWDAHSRGAARAAAYPPFQHVIYVIKENRTYDQVFSDLTIGDGDSTLLFFPRRVSPNHHALAERFGLFDRFFCSAEVSPDGHNWSMAAYVSDYAEKTIPSQYSSRRHPYDYEGINHHMAGDGWSAADIPDDDVNEPANGYLWNLAERAHISFRDYGEFVLPQVEWSGTAAETSYIGNKPFLRTHTSPRYPGFNLDISDQRRIPVWLDEFTEYVRTRSLPALEIVRLPSDHTYGATAGKRTPLAYMADNDLALGRMIDALSASPYWTNTVVFVVEDDAQNGPDHVDSHRAPFMVISAYNRPGVYHRWTNTTDVVATIGDILHLGRLSQYDAFGRPLSDVFSTTPDTSRYVVRPANISLDSRNPGGTSGAADSRRLDFSSEDRADEDLFNRVLWRTIKGPAVAYPGTHHAPPLELKRSR
jgi:YVTN family beta-propeller protein